MKDGGTSVVLLSATSEKGHTEVKYIDKMLIASGVTLLLTGGVAAAALAPTTAGANLYFRPSGPSGPSTTNTFRLCRPSYKGRDIVISATGRVNSVAHTTTSCP